MAQTAQFDRLRDVIRLAQSRPAVAEHRPALKEAVCAIVEVMQGAGMPVEAIIIQIKRETASLGHPPTGEDLVVDAVRLCIQHYYRASPSGRD